MKLTFWTRSEIIIDSPHLNMPDSKETIFSFVRRHLLPHLGTLKVRIDWLPCNWFCRCQSEYKGLIAGSRDEFDRLFQPQASADTMPLPKEVDMDKIVIFGTNRIVAAVAEWLKGVPMDESSLMHEITRTLTQKSL